MPKNKSAVSRYYVIDVCLVNKLKPFPTIEDLAKACSEKIRDGISTSTIEKDIREMKMARPIGYDAPIEYSKKHKGYFYAEQGFSISALQLADEEWEGLKYAANLLNQYAEIPIFKDFRQAIQKINTRFNLLIDMDETDSDKFVQFETGIAMNGYEWIATIYPALRNRWLLSIGYENIYKNEVKKYIIQPVLLKEHRNKWYVIGWVEARKDYLTFALERIQDIQPIEKKQKHRIDFNPDKFLQHSVGIMEVDSIPEKVVLTITAPYHKLLQLEPMHRSQKIIEQKEREIKVEIQVNINEELCKNILSFGPYCKVLQPQKLKKQIQELIINMNNLYK